MSEPKKELKKIPLKNLSDLAEANEWLFNRQNNGLIDAKTSDAMNTTLKGQFKLIVEVPMKLLAMTLQARYKKVQIDPAMFERFGISAPVLPAQIE